jgi:hypothetical protein
MTLSPAAQAELEALTHRQNTVLSRAFDLVDPSKINPRPGVTWKDPIHAYVTARTLQHCGLTLADIKEAVEHYTATEATVTEPGEHIYLVTAIGYRAGPAGDH